MSEEDRRSGNKRWVFLDLETTGLDPDRLTILEAAWTVTDSSLFQKTPIRSRFTEFSANSSYGTISPSSSSWTRNVSEFVIRMHADSGLTNDWLDCPRSRLVKSIAELDRLILDDLFLSGWDGESQFVLAGAGLAAFDRIILGVSKSQLLEYTHYRSADSSVACELLGLSVPKSLESTKSFIEGWLSSEDNFVLGEGITLPDWKSSQTHRSAVDVSLSILIARSLRKRLRTISER